MKKIGLIHLLVFWCINLNVDAQDFSYAVQLLKTHDLEPLKNKKTALNISSEQLAYINWQIRVIKHAEVDSMEIKNVLKSLNHGKGNKALKYMMLGDYYLYKNVPEDSLAYNFYTKSIEHSVKKKDTVLIAESCKKILNQLYKSRLSIDGYPIYLKIYQSYLYDSIEKATYQFHFYNYEGSVKRIEHIDNLKKTLFLLDDRRTNFLKAKIHQLIGVEYDFFHGNQDSSLVYYKKAKALMQDKNYKHFQHELFGINANIALIYLRNNDYRNAKTYFSYTDTISLPKFRYKEKEKVYKLLADIEAQSNNWKNAYEYIQLKNAYADTLKEYTKAIRIAEFKTKYQTEKKENENLQLKANHLQSEAKRKQNQNVAIGLGGSLALGSIIAFLIFKNTKRQQKLAEQGKALQTQKLATVLKEQELTTIDAMIEGQEKERQRIANDLHDDLGGLMATVKLHFNALKDKDSPELYDKTNNLIEEAYQKVRSVAHAKNSGVIAKRGLLIAVQDMADKISAANKIQIDVIDHGLDNRLENSLELTLFRIIQELVTNIIKHAEATEANIHLTNHDESINIMVEDNGKGFTPNQITITKTGMGISSIDKRVEHLGGTMTIESEKNKGTTVIIDIPLR